VPMGPAELFTSLQQGVVDAQENPLEYVQFTKFYEVQKYGIDTRHVIGAMTWIFSDARFKRLPADVQALLKEEGERVMLEATERMIGLEGEIQKQLADAGMKFNEVDRAAFAAKLEPMGKEFPELAPWVEKFR